MSVQDNPGEGGAKEFCCELPNDFFANEPEDELALVYLSFYGWPFSERIVQLALEDKLVAPSVNLSVSPIQP